MAKTLGNLKTEALYRLGDTAESIWSRDEIESYVKEGYDKFCMETEILWAFKYLEDSGPYTGTHVAEWELPYLTYAEEVFNHTESWEDAYIQEEAPIGPANHTAAWEWRNSYVDPHIPGTVDLPEDLYKIERITWNSERVEPMYSTEMEKVDPLYKTETGSDVICWIWDQDGIRKLRRYPIPTTQTYTAISGTWGIPRGLDADYTDETEEGTWGIPRITPAGLPPDGIWGIPRYYPAQTGNTKVEYIRRGVELVADDDALEIPDHYCRHVRHYAMGRALERESAGQDTRLANHFLDRFRLGVVRVSKRKSRLESARTRQLGGPTQSRERIPSPRLPYNYGREVRFGRR